MIIGVAVRNQVTGEVRSLPAPARHCNLFAEYNDAPNVREFCAQHGLESFAGRGWPSEEIRCWEQGFVDELGQWYSRREAYAHAHARAQARKLRGRRGEDEGWGTFDAPSEHSGLFSEDVW